MPPTLEELVSEPMLKKTGWHFNYLRHTLKVSIIISHIFNCSPEFKLKKYIKDFDSNFNKTEILLKGSYKVHVNLLGRITSWNSAINK